MAIDLKAHTLALLDVPFGLRASLPSSPFGLRPTLGILKDLWLSHGKSKFLCMCHLHLHRMLLNKDRLSQIFKKTAMESEAEVRRESERRCSICSVQSSWPAPVKPSEKWYEVSPSFQRISEEGKLLFDHELNSLS